LGVGGGVFTVPYIHQIAYLENWEKDLIPPVASGSSLFLAFILSLSATVRNWKKGKIRFDLAWPMGFGAIAGAYIGARFAENLDPSYLVIIFSLLVGSGGLKSIITLLGKNDGSEEDRESPIHPYTAILPGIVVGVVSSLTGLGGGIIMVPLLQIVYKKNIRTSIIISNFCIVLTALSGSLAYAFPRTDPGNLGDAIRTGYLNWSILFPLVLGAIPGGYLGSYFAEKLKQKYLMVFFGILQISVGFGIFWSYFSN